MLSTCTFSTILNIKNILFNDLMSLLQSDQLNMAEFFLVPCKSDLSVYATVNVYTGQVTFHKVPGNTAILIGHPVGEKY